MSDLAMALLAMTAPHHQWPAPPPKEPVTVVRTAEDIKPPRELSEQERAALKQALDRTARCATGGLIYDPEIGLYVPEFRRGCLPPSRPPKMQP